MRLVWATDLHLDHVVGLKALAFSRNMAPYDLILHQLAEKRPGAVVLSGDTGTAKTVGKHLRQIAKIAPTYFVLGNHDYYGGSIKAVRRWARRIRTKDLHWLQAKGVVQLTEEVGLVGVDGWGDARVGNVHESPVGLSDWQMIEELTHPYPIWSERSRRLREGRLQGLGSDDAGMLERALTGALERFRKVFVVTHVPPWPEAAWYNGKPSGLDWLPWFCCRATGEVISKCAGEWRDREIVVLCGHTHGGGESQILPNVRALTGPASYGAPAVQRVFEV
jgi:hypothetical protein